MLTPTQYTDHTLVGQLSQIRDVIGKNYQGDTLFIAKLILHDFNIAYNEELIALLRGTFTGDSSQDNEIKEYIVSLLPIVNFEFIIEFLGENNLDLLGYIYPRVNHTYYENIRPYVLNYHKYNQFTLFAIVKISKPITLDSDIEGILLNPDVDVLIRLEIYRKLNLSEDDRHYLTIDKLPSNLQRCIKNESLNATKNLSNNPKPFTPDEKFKNNLWNVEKDGDKKAIIFYLRYHAITAEFRETLKELIRKVRFEIESGNTDFEKIIIVFRGFNQYDRSLAKLIEDGNDIIQFAFVKGRDFQTLINSPNRHMVHFTQSTPEELLDKRNGISIITEEIPDRFNFRQHGISDYVELPWSANYPKIMDEDWYIDTFMQCFRALSPRSDNKFTKLILTIIEHGSGSNNIKI